MPPQNIVFLTILTQFFHVVDRCISGCRIFNFVCPASSSVLLIHAVRDERVNGEGFSYWSWTGAMIDHFTICWKYPKEIEHNHYNSYFHKLAVAQHMTTNSSDVWSFCGANMNRPTHPQQIMHPPPPPCQFHIMCGSVTTLQNGPSNKLTLEVFRGNSVLQKHSSIDICHHRVLFFNDTYSHLPCYWCILACRTFNSVCLASSSVLLIHAVRDERVNGEGFSYWSWTGAMIDH